MGDRRNIIVTTGEGKPGVSLYTHWSGTDLEDTLADALERGESRWDDAEYLARVIFQEMIGQDNGVIGYGIGLALDGKTASCEPGAWDLVVNTGDQTITWSDWSRGEYKLAFTDFVREYGS